MGTITSSLRGIRSLLRESYLSITVLISEISASATTFQQLVSRVSASPGLPAECATEPFWLQDPPFPELCDVRTEGLLGGGGGGGGGAGGAGVVRADVVVIGSGVTGAAVCWGLLREAQRAGRWAEGGDEGAGMGGDRLRRVVMLEARSVCSGATGRNGGHVKATPWELIRALKLRGVTGERARKIVDFQRRHLDILLELCEAEGFDAAELREVETVDLFVNAQGWEEAKELVKELGNEKGLEDVGWGLQLWDGEEARERFHTGSHVMGAISYRAGALWPYRLVTSILSSLLKEYSGSFSIETHTAVEGISMRHDPQVPFCVHTSRGDIIASHVIHATNGHSATLIPGLRGRLFPVRGQMTAQMPGKSFPHLDGARSWSIIHNMSGFEYMTQRPGLPDSVSGKGGELMLGGALFQSGGPGLDEIGISSDADLNFNIGTYLGGVLPMLFGAQNWGADAEAGRVRSMWTGIMGFTVDVMPFVGRLESSITGRDVPRRHHLDGVRKQEDQGLSTLPGEWIAAGYNGEGMVNAWLCGVALGIMLVGRENEDLEAVPGMPGGKAADWLPAEYLISKERLAKSSIYDLASML